MLTQPLLNQVRTSLRCMPDFLKSLLCGCMRVCVAVCLPITSDVIWRDMDRV